MKLTLPTTLRYACFCQQIGGLPTSVYGNNRRVYFHCNQRLLGLFSRTLTPPLVVPGAFSIQPLTDCWIRTCDARNTIVECPCCRERDDTSHGFVYCCCSSFRLPSKPSGRFEDDVIPFLKMIRYPFQLSKSSLAAVGAPQTWPKVRGEENLV